MEKKTTILFLFLIVSIVCISGCTSDNQTNNTTNTTTTTTTTTTTVHDNSTGQNNTPQTVNAQTYVGNSNTHKFHRQSCRYVNEMNDGNKVYFSTRQEAIDAGYTPCKVCNP